MRFFICLLVGCLLAPAVAFSQLLIPDQVTVMGTQIGITAEGRARILEKYNSLTIHPRSYYELLSRCYLFFPVIDRELQEAGVPNELKYLALQESLLNGDAVSRSNAVGYWQFKEMTAKEYALRVDMQVDERRNIISSTRGAAAYIRKSHGFLQNNWMYAVLSYYTGLTGARNYVRDNQIDLTRTVIDGSTHFYLVHFLAHYFAFKDEIALMDAKRPPIYLLEYVGGTGNTLADIARFTMSEADRNRPDAPALFNQWLESIRSVNTWLQGARVPDDKYYSVVMPIHPSRRDELIGRLQQFAYLGKVRARREVFYVDSVQQAYPFIVEDFSRPSPSSFQFATVNGLKAIVPARRMRTAEAAKALGMAEADLVRYNELDGKVLLPGEPYYLEAKTNTMNLSYHLVGQGERLKAIGQRYGIQTDTLRQYNRFQGEVKLQPGDRVWLVAHDEEE